MKKVLTFGFLLGLSASSFAFVTQGHWRWRNDDGSETSATWKAAQDAGSSVTDLSKNLRLRMRFANLNDENSFGEGASGFGTNILVYSADNGATWDSVSTIAGTRHFALAASTNLPNGTSTSAQLSPEDAGFFPSTKYTRSVETGKTVSTINGTSYHQVGVYAETEYEWVLKPTAKLKGGKTYIFKVGTGNPRATDFTFMGDALFYGVPTLTTGRTAVGIKAATSKTLATINSFCGTVFRGKTYTASADVADTVRSVSGWDSLYNVTKIVVKPMVAKIVKATVTGNCHVAFKGIDYTAGRVVSDTIKSVFGCDSIINQTTLKVNYIKSTTITSTVRNFSSVTYRGTTYTTGTVVARDTVKSINGCDSVLYIVNIPLTGGSSNGRVGKPNQITLNVPEVATEDKWVVAPNPVTGGVMNVAVQSATKKTIVLKLIDATGRQLMQQKATLLPGDNDIHIRVNSAIKNATGIYYLQAEGMNGNVTQRVIIQK